MIYVYIRYGIFPVAAQNEVLFHVVWSFSDVRSDGSVLCRSMWRGWATRQVINRDAILRQKTEYFINIATRRGENYVMRSLMYSSPISVRMIKVEKNGMGGACSAYGGEEGRIQGFDGET
jgi:hypothetical protein